MNNLRRAYGFKGTDAAYILFLEDMLTRTLSLLHQSPQSRHALSLPHNEPLRLLTRNPDQSALLSCHRKALKFVEYTPSKRPRLESARAAIVGGTVQELASNSTTVTTITTKTLKSEWFTALNRFIDDFTTVDNWHTARQQAGLYSSVENDIVISFLMDDYDEAGISFLLECHKGAASSFEAAISSFNAIQDGNTYRKPAERCSQNPVEFMEACRISTEKIEKLGDSLASSVKLHRLITKISLFKDIIYGTLCRLLELGGTDNKDVNSFMAKRFNYSVRHLYHLRLGCGWVVRMISELQNETKSDTDPGWGNRISEGLFLGTAYFHFK